MKPQFSTVYQIGVLQYYLDDYPAADAARALEDIGRTHLQDGQPSRAAPPLRQALAIYRKFGSPHAPRVEELVRDHDL